MKLVSPDGEYTVDTDDPEVEHSRALTLRALGWATKEQHAASAKADADAARARDDSGPEPATPKIEKGRK